LKGVIISENYPEEARGKNRILNLFYWALLDGGPQAQK